MDVVRYTVGMKAAISRYTYRGEGNAHLALALPDERKILLIKKENRSLLKWQFLFKSIYCDKIEQIRDINFFKFIMVPLLSPYVDDLILVNLKAGETNLVEKNISKLRPVNRLGRRLRNDHAAIFNDYTLFDKKYDFNGDTFAIEIKPKQGFRSLPDNICHFCDKQKLKLKQGKIQKITSYCPLDLFSGDEPRMYNAITALADNPQNNLQMYKNGKPCYRAEHVPTDLNLILGEIFNHNDTKRLKENFCELVTLCLLHEFPSQTDHKCKLKTISHLPQNCVLNKIYTLQNFDRFGTLSSDLELEDFEYVHRYLEDTENDENLCPACVASQYLEMKEECEENDTLSVGSSESEGDRFEFVNQNFCWGTNDISNVILYSISKIAKDCSIMITFKKIDNVTIDLPDENCIETTTAKFLINVRIFDLYPKQLRKT